MLRKSLQLEALPMIVLPWDMRKCRWIANCAIVQCLVVYFGSVTILYCFWTPDKSSFDYNILARIMYLYDYEACGYRLHSAAALSNIRLPNETHGFDVLPIKWKRAIITVSTRLSAKTRKYIELSLGVHVMWMLIAIALNIITRKSRNPTLLKVILFIFFYSTISVIIFDISMAFLYIGHIQQSLTKGMVLRYSGWSVELKLKSYEEFAGWLPITASILWMRGIVILGTNIYSCKVICAIRRKIRKREVKTKVLTQEYFPIPEPKHDQANDRNVLYFRTGENRPFVRNDILSKVFFN